MGRRQRRKTEKEGWGKERKRKSKAQREGQKEKTETHCLRIPDVVLPPGRIVATGLTAYVRQLSDKPRRRLRLHRGYFHVDATRANDSEFRSPFDPIRCRLQRARNDLRLAGGERRQRAASSASDSRRASVLGFPIDYRLFASAHGEAGCLSWTSVGASALARVAFHARARRIIERKRTSGLLSLFLFSWLGCPN
jgi:hypothetical protein